MRLLTFPIVAYSVYDYIKNLKGLTYPSEEYVKTREEVSACPSIKCLGKQEGRREASLPESVKWRHLFQGRVVHRHAGEDSAQGVCGSPKGVAGSGASNSF